jgi:hypothetical protein
MQMQILLLDIRIRIIFLLTASARFIVIIKCGYYLLSTY